MQIETTFQKNHPTHAGQWPNFLRADITMALFCSRVLVSPTARPHQHTMTLKLKQLQKIHYISIYTCDFPTVTTQDTHSMTNACKHELSITQI